MPNRIAHDSRGPSRKILEVQESPTGGPTFIILSCGHRVERVNHFAYRVGDDDRCRTCGREGRS